MRLSSRLLVQGCVKERLRSSLMKFYGRYGDLIKQYEIPLSRMLHDILGDYHIQWHPKLIRHYTNDDIVTDLDLITEFDFLPNCERLSLGICDGCGMPSEDACSPEHLVLSHFGICKWSNAYTNLSWTCLVSGLLSFEHSSVLLFCPSPRLYIHIYIETILVFSLKAPFTCADLHTVCKLYIYV